jgi:hypothetical protein
MAAPGLTCPDCTRNGGAYNLRCLPCAARFLRDHPGKEDWLCRKYGHGRSSLLAAAKAYRNGPADSR